jgi:hypothetical protein
MNLVLCGKCRTSTVTSNATHCCTEGYSRTSLANRLLRWIGKKEAHLGALGFELQKTSKKTKILTGNKEEGKKYYKALC